MPTQPSILDVQTPFDVTGYSQISAAQLEQFAGGITPYADKGIILVTTDINGVATVPNANTTPKWQNYIWLRVQTGTTLIYVWNPNVASDPTYLNWISGVNISIPPGSITSSMLAPGVTTGIIDSVAANGVPSLWVAQLNANNTGYQTNGLMNNTSLVFGDMAAGSTVGIPTIGNGAVTGAKIANQTITGVNLANNTLTPTQMANSGGTSSTASTIGSVDPQVNIIVPTTSLVGIPNGANATEPVAAGDILCVTSDKKGYTTCSNPVAIIQQVQTIDTTAATSSSSNNQSVAPTTSNNTAISSLTCSITPKSSTSTIDVEMLLNLSCTAGANGAFVNAVLFRDAGANGIAAATVNAPITTSMHQVLVRYSVSNLTSGTPTTFKAYFSGYNGGSAVTVNYNSTDGSTKLFGGTLGVNSYIKITEHY